MIDLFQLLTYIVYGIIKGSVFGLTGIGLALIYGIFNIINMAHGELYMLGGYVAYFCLTLFGLPPILAIIIAGVTLFFVGVILEMILIAPIRKRSSEHISSAGIMSTLGMGIMLQNLALLVWGPRYKSATFFEGSLNLGGIMISMERVFAAFFALGAVIILYYFVRKTKMGKAIRATSQNLDAASLMGINIKLIYSITFALASMLAGFAGALLLPVYQIYPTVGINAVTMGFSIVALGGLGSVEGAFIGGYILGIAESLTAGYFAPTWTPAVSFSLIILVLVFRPQGLLGKT